MLVILALLVSPAPQADEFGRALCGVGDLDGDGVGDLVLSDPVHGEVWAVSAKGNTPIWRAEGDGAFGTRLSAAGDVDGDEREDVLVLGPGPVVSVVSGHDGGQLFRFPGQCLGAPGDLDRDGHADLLAGTTVRSGKNGEALFELEGVRDAGVTFLRSLEGERSFDVAVVRGGTSFAVVSQPGGEVRFEVSTLELWDLSTDLTGFHPRLDVRPCGDLDGDGALDLLVAQGELMLGSPGRTYGFSGRDGHLLFALNAGTDDYGDALRNDLIGLGDLDGDGVGELAIAWHGRAWSGPDLGGLDECVAVYSGKNRQALYGLGPKVGGHPAFSATSIDDLDGDGVPELVVGSTRTAAGGRGPGRVCAYSGKTREPLFELTRKLVVGALRVR
jgi:hypothetical protein